MPQFSHDEILMSAPTARSRTSSQKVVRLDQAVTLRRRYNEVGRQVVFTNGCFDLLHVGHLHSLEEAASCGDVLFVAVNSDSSVRRLKGPGRPVIEQEQRLRLIAALECVDHVLVLEDDTPLSIIEALQPNVLVKGVPWTPETVIGSVPVIKHGGKVVITDVLEGISTTSIVSRLSTKPELS